MTKLQNLFVALLTAATVGCEPSSEDTATRASLPASAAPRLFLSPKDMNPPSGVVSIPDASIADVIAGEMGFYLRPANPASGAADECQKQLGKSLKIKASETELSMDGSGTAKDCLPNSADPSTTILNGQLRVQVYLKCNDTDLSEYDGQPYHEFKLAEVKCGDGQMTYALQYNTKQMTKTPELELSAEISFRATQFRSDGGPCRISNDGSGSRVDECVHTRTSVATGVSAAGSKASSIGNPRSLFPTSFSELTWRGVEYKRASDRLFRGGKIEFKIQNWTGSMRYSGTEPKWNATDGKSSKEGVFGATSQ
jgi:hypothetical protein